MKPNPLRRLTFLPALAVVAILPGLAPGVATAQIGQRPTTPGSEDATPNTRREETELDRKFWEADVPGGNFLIALGNISFVSIHEYIVDGNVRVHEVSIGSGSSALARFYHLELLAENSPVTATKTLLSRAAAVAETAAARTGTEEVWKKVQKNYPASTHAHTVEYRLEYLEDLKTIHASVKGAWWSGRGAKITIRNE